MLNDNFRAYLFGIEKMERGCKQINGIDIVTFAVKFGWLVLIIIAL
jgi:hypothetical protein